MPVTEVGAVVLTSIAQCKTQHATSHVVPRRRPSCSLVYTNGCRKQRGVRRTHHISSIRHWHNVWSLWRKMMPTQSAGCMLLRLLLCNIWYMCICAQHLPVVAIFNSPWNSVSGLHTYRNKIWMLLFLFMYRNIVLYLWYAVYCVAEQTVYLVWCFHHPNLIPLKIPHRLPDESPFQ